MEERVLVLDPVQLVHGAGVEMHRVARLMRSQNHREQDHENDQRENDRRRHF
jgi:hypothetical protein